MATLVYDWRMSILRTYAKNFLDKMGIAVTSLCALHCIILPFLLPLLPLVGLTFIVDEAFEISLFATTVVLGFSALSSGYFRYHRRLYPMLLLFVGCFIYVMKLLFGIEDDPVFVMLSASFIVAAHMLNMKFTNEHDRCECHS